MSERIPGHRIRPAHGGIPFDELDRTDATRDATASRWLERFDHYLATWTVQPGQERRVREDAARAALDDVLGAL